MREGGGPNEVSIPFALKDAGGRLAEGDLRSEIDGERRLLLLKVALVGERRLLGDCFAVVEPELSLLPLVGRLAT
jgi:hypothetical protein